MENKNLTTIRVMLSVLLAAAIAAMCVSCSSDQSLRRIRKSGSFNVGYASPDASVDVPFVIDESTGITAEPATKTARTLDASAVFTRLNSTEAYNSLLSGEVDCLWNVMPPKKKDVSSVRTIETGIYYRQVIMTTAESEITRLADVSGKVMAVVSGSDAQAELHEAAVMEGSLREIKIFTSFGELMEALTTGAADCAAVDEPQALYYMMNAEGQFKLIDTPIAEKSLVIATRAEDAELCAKIAERYVKLAQNGEIKALCAKYTGGNGINESMQAAQSA